ncbi:MAG: hypothetical protein U5K76_00345 [Woeseiaceae bacterium]|nr:hypothetical protein [Woeseiaceae bacterium]
MPAWLVRAGLVLAVVLGGYLTFEFGRIQAGYNVADAMQDRQAYKRQIGELEDQVESLREQVALLEDTSRHRPRSL